MTNTLRRKLLILSPPQVQVGLELLIGWARLEPFHVHAVGHDEDFSVRDAAAEHIRA